VTAEPAVAQVLEPVAARAWPPAESAAIGGWRLHASSGFSGRIDACWPLAAPDRPVGDAIAFVEAWYAARGLPPLFKIVDGGGDPAELAGRLTALGYGPRTETLMMTGALRPLCDQEVRLSDAVGEGFAAVFAAAGSGDAGDANERLCALRRIPPPRAFARLDIEGRPVAIGACAVEGRWSGIFAMRTDARHRRRGIAGRILGALMTEAADAGAVNAYLRVEANNATARRLYDGWGFTEAYRYRYWARG